VSWPIFRSGEFLLEQKIVVFKATLAEARFFFFHSREINTRIRIAFMAIFALVKFCH